MCDRVRFAERQTHLATRWGWTPGGDPGPEQVQRLQSSGERRGPLPGGEGQTGTKVLRRENR